MNKGDFIDFNYTGSIQTFVVPNSGLYKLEVWGACGGSASVGGYANGGNGGYASGEIKLKKGTTLAIACGGAGSYNCGGGAASYRGDGSWGYVDAGAGGGATHIATSNRGTLNNYSQNLDELLIVAGGGGGAYSSISSQQETWRAGGSNGGDLATGTFSPLGANGNIGSKSEAFVITGNGGGGGGYTGGGGFGGGTSYLKDTLINTEYVVGSNNTNGKAKITLLKKGNRHYGDVEITRYYGDKEISRHYGNKDM